MDDLPSGFQLDDHPTAPKTQAAPDLPSGFQMDPLPEGFKLDEPQQDNRILNPATGQKIGIDQNTAISDAANWAYTKAVPWLYNTYKNQLTGSLGEFGKVGEPGAWSMGEYKPEFDPKKPISTFTTATGISALPEAVKGIGKGVAGLGSLPWAPQMAGSQALVNEISGGKLSPEWKQLLGTGAFMGARSAGERIGSARPMAPQSEVPPTNAVISNAGQQLDTAKSNNVAITERATYGLINNLNNTLQKYPIEDRNKMLERVLTYLDTQRNPETPYKELVDLRQVINRDTDNKNLRAAASDVRRVLDDFRDNLRATSPEIASGHMLVPETMAAHRQGVEDYSLGKQSQALEDPVRRAQIMQAAKDYSYSTDRSIRAQYGQTVSKPGGEGVRGLNAYQSGAAQAMEDIVQGGSVDTVARTLARLDPTRSGWGAMPWWATRALTEALGTTSTSLPIAAIAGLLGMIGRWGANARTMEKAAGEAERIRGLSSLAKQVKPTVPVARHRLVSLPTAIGAANPFTAQQLQEEQP